MLEVRPFEPSDLTEAAALLAARQRRDRERLPMLAAALADQDACRMLLEHVLGRPRGDGAVARTDGRLAGFLFGERMLFGPGEVAAKYFEPRSISMPPDGHACAAPEDPVAVYRALYAGLAAGWAREGFYVHQVHITAGDAALQEAWVNLGFGRGITCATRPTGPVLNARAVPGVEIHEAAPEDIEVVIALGMELYEFHSRAPIFWPALREPLKAARLHTEALLTDPANAHFVAYREGRPVAMQTFERPGFIPSTVEQATNVYLHEGVVSGAERGGGIGTMLLERSMAWAREQGDRWCTLHFASANPSGGPFWLGQGFEPVEYTMSRHLDERVAFANAW